MWICCDSIQSQGLIVYLSSSVQSSLCDRCIINELEQITCLYISTNSSDTIYSNENPSISVQNSSNCSSLAPTFLVLRDVTSISPDLTSILSKLTNTRNGKVSTSKPPNSCTSHLGVIRQSIRDKKFSQNFAAFVTKSRRASSQKVYDAKWICILQFVS